MARSTNRIAAIYGWSDVQSFYQQLCSNIREAILFWTPERLEQEALRRAALEAAPTIVSREVHAFTALHFAAQEELSHEVRHGIAEGAYNDRVRPHLEAFERMLEMLERRAATVEARATDFRIQIGLSDVRAAVERSHLATDLAKAIDEAVRQGPSTDAVAMLRDLEHRLARVEATSIATMQDVVFIADFTSKELVARMLPGVKARALVEKLGTAAAVGTLKTLLAEIASRMDNF